MIDSGKIQEFVENIKKCHEFVKLNYFLRSMKKMPHGGVINIGIPNCFMKHYSPFEALRMYFPRLGGDIRYSYVFYDCVNNVKEIMEAFNILVDDLLFYICCSLESICIWWYLSCCLAFPKDYSSENMMIDIYKIIDQKSIEGTDCAIKSDEIIILFLCVLSHFTPIDNIASITKHELLQPNCDKYGLSDISTARYTFNGYIIDNLFYPYNVFFDTSIGSPISREPLLIELMKSIDAVSILMRRDNAIALEAEKAYAVATADSQVFRGTMFNISKMDIRRKNEIVRYDPNTMNKLYLSVVPMESEAPNILSLVIEELWSPDLVDDNIVTTIVI